MSQSQAQANSVWLPFDGGSSIGREGSEEGIIVRDETHPHGARITLERDLLLVPFAITCAIYGWIMHTRYFATEAEAQQAFDEMKPELAKILSLIPAAGDPEADAAFPAIVRALDDFIERYPRV
jgi:hypothetical protein